MNGRRFPVGAALRCCVLLMLLQALSPRWLGADELTQLDVSENDGVYTVEVSVTIDAPLEYVKAVITDYKHIYRINPTIVESGILPAPGGEGLRVRTVLKGCVVFFCKNVDRVEDIRELTPEDFQSVIVPELSDIRSGTAIWSVRSRGQRTRLIYQAYVEPDFFIPPLIGSYFVKKKIREELMTSFSRIECVAQVQARLDRRPRLQMASLEPDRVCGGK